MLVFEIFSAENPQMFVCILIGHLQTEAKGEQCLTVLETYFR